MWGGLRELEGLAGGYLVWGFLEGDMSNELIGGRVMRPCALVIVREGGEGGRGEEGEGSVERSQERVVTFLTT